MRFESLVKLNPQYGEYNLMIDFVNRFLNTQYVYGQTLLGSEQAKQHLQNMAINMTVNGFYDIQKFNQLL